MPSYGLEVFNLAMGFVRMGVLWSEGRAVTKLGR